MSIQFLGMIGHRLASRSSRRSDLSSTSLTSPLSHAPTKRPASIESWSATGRTSRMDSWWPPPLAGHFPDRSAAGAPPGFVAPTLAARKLATLEHLLDGAWRYIEAAHKKTKVTQTLDKVTVAANG